jgi:hypothetical protein
MNKKRKDVGKFVFYCLRFSSIAMLTMPTIIAMNTTAIMEMSATANARGACVAVGAAVAAGTELTDTEVVSTELQYDTSPANSAVIV